MNENELLKVLASQFGYLARSTGETLIAHHYTTYSVLRKLISYSPSIRNNEKECKQLLLAALTHDIGKNSQKNQEILRGRQTGKVIHKLSLEEYASEISPYKESLNLSSADIKEIYDIIITHHSISDADLDNIALKNAGFFTRLLMTADWLASMDQISFPTLNFIRGFFEGRIGLTCFEFSRFPSPFTYLALHRLNNAYKDLGWDLLLSLDSGSVFIGSTDLALPEKTALVEKFYDLFLQKSLAYQKPNPKNFTKAMLSGMSKLHPYIFLQVQHDRFKEMLSDKEDKPLVFFKFIKETLDVSGDLAKLRDELWGLDMLAAGSGTRGVPIIKKKWEERTNGEPAEKLNQIIRDIFDVIRLKEILPQHFWCGHHGNAELKGLKTGELFEIVSCLTEQYDVESQKDRDVKNYLSLIISMEEETNFREHAQNIFDRYKTYKLTINPERGVCERCGSPLSERMQPALGFADGTSSSFSQIKAEYGDRATCGFCAFDNMAARKEVRGGQTPIYVKVQSKISELIENNHSLLNFIREIRDGLRTLTDIMELKDMPEMGGILVPEDLPLPVGKAKKQREVEPLKMESGLLIPIDSLPFKKYSPKDLQAQLEPLFHLLTLMGYTVSIGTEEQIGLFGQKIEVTKEKYFLSLAVIILANIVNKEKGKYIFAKNLLEKSPSAALMELETAISGKKKKGKLFKKKEVYFLRCLFNSSLKITNIPNGGEYSMKDLLHHAKRLADRETGMPQFCKGDILSNMTKHSTTAPISQALDELMRTGDADMAFSRFLDKLSVKIPKDKAEQLNEFLKFVRKLINDFKELRDERIGDFIRTKNALMSAVFILTRYKDVKEVLND